MPYPLIDTLPFKPFMPYPLIHTLPFNRYSTILYLELELILIKQNIFLSNSTQLDNFQSQETFIFVFIGILEIILFLHLSFYSLIFQNYYYFGIYFFIHQYFRNHFGNVLYFGLSSHFFWKKLLDLLFYVYFFLFFPSTIAFSNSSSSRYTRYFSLSSVMTSSFLLLQPFKY